MHDRVRHHRQSSLALSSIAYAELWFGVMNAPDRADLMVRLQCIELPILAFNEDDARAAGEIRSTLRKAGTPIGPLDVLIAGQARARDLTLVTHNLREFSRVPGLHVEDWEA